jgi:hypothetical protein
MGWIEYSDGLGFIRRIAFCRKYDHDQGRFFAIDDPDYEHAEYDGCLHFGRTSCRDLNASQTDIGNTRLAAGTVEECWNFASNTLV